MISLDEQLVYFDRHAERAYARALQDYKRRKTEILAEARRRLEAGYSIYGDAGWRWDYDRLRQAELEEAADMVVYRLMRMYQGGRHDRRVCSRPI